MQSDDSGYDGEASFKFAHEEIEYIILLLEQFFKGSEGHESQGIYGALLKRFNKAQYNNRKHAQVDLQGDEEVGCYHCILKTLVESSLKVLRQMLMDEGIQERKAYEEMALHCTILAKLSIPSEDDDGDHWSTAAAAA